MERRTRGRGNEIQRANQQPAPRVSIMGPKFGTSARLRFGHLRAGLKSRPQGQLDDQHYSHSRSRHERRLRGWAATRPNPSRAVTAGGTRAREEARPREGFLAHASLGGRGVAARHDLPHALIHSLLGVTRHAARRRLAAGVLPAFPDGNHRWLLAFPSLGKRRRAEEERPGETGPTVDPVAVSALPRRAGRSVGSTSRFGRDCWPQGQPQSTPYSENVSKTPRRKITPPRGRDTETPAGENQPAEGGARPDRHREHHA